MSDQSKIIAKIKALIAKANSTEHEAEAAAFMGKANELLEQHQIDLGALQDADDPVRVKLDGFAATDSAPSWHKDLFVAVGRLYGCRAVKSGQYVKTKTGLARGYQIELTGRESALVTTELMFPWIKSQCNAAGRKLAVDHPERNAAWHARRVGNALTLRIWGLIREQEKKVDQPKTAAAKNALVTQDRVLAVFNEHYDNLKSGRGRARSSNAAARNAASGIGLHRQAGGASQLRLK